MNDREALLAGILANPDDDLPRLVFADHLDEHGDADDAVQAEFIRGQIEMATLYPYTRRWMKLSHLTKAILQKREAEWSDTGRMKVINRVFARGFLHGVTVYAKGFVKDGADLFQHQPIRSIKFVKLSSMRGSVPMNELAWCPHLAKANKLDFTDSELKPLDFRTLGESPHAKQLCSLVMGGYNPFASGINVSSLLSLPALTELSLVHNRGFARADLAILGRDFAASRLHILDLDGSRAADRGLHGLLRSPHLTQLETLRIGGDGDNAHPEDPRFGEAPLPTVAELETALRETAMPNLRSLSLAKRNLKWTDAKLLAKAEHWPKLEYLNLSNNNLGIRGIEELAAAPFATTLKVLDLRYNNLDPEHFERIRDRMPQCELIG